MITLRLHGRALPFGINLSAEVPEIKWKWDDGGVDFVFRVKIVDSAITVECDLEEYKPEYLSELYKRTTDLAKAAANMAAFATGYGIVVMMEVMIGPDGAPIALHRQEQIPPASRTSISLDPAARQEFGRSVGLVITEPSLFIALDDLIHAITSSHTCAADCGRVVDRIRRMIAPSLDGAAAWREMHHLLNIDRDYQEWVSKLSTGSRHGDPTFVPGTITSEATKRAWAIWNRMLEYRRRGNQPLTAPDFPLLK